MADVNERLFKLLNMAAGTANIAEANIAAVKAAELMRQHKLRPDDLFRVEYVFVHAEPASTVNRAKSRKESKWAFAAGRVIGALLREVICLVRQLISAAILRRM